MNQGNTKKSKLLTQKSRRMEVATRSILRFMTYCVIGSAGFIFLHIAYNGAPVLFKAEAPFLNIEFLTEKPQTLHVFEPKRVTGEMQRIKQEIDNLEGSTEGHEQQLLREKRKAYSTLDAERRKQRLLFSDIAYRELDSPPSPEAYVYSSYAYSAGGIAPAIIGTALLVAGSIVIALALGISCAIYLSEYSRPGLLLQIIRLSVLNLSGVPSIVFGLFGFGIFVLFFGWGVSLIAGWFTLAIMALPVIIASSEEALRSVPQEYREGSLGLGASKWTTIRTNVLPYALPGILTSSIMAIARVAGETAPILFTAAFALRDKLPWEGLEEPSGFFFQGVMALPYHIYVLTAKLPQSEYTREVQYGSVFVFMLVVGFFALTSIVLRQKLRVKYGH